MCFALEWMPRVPDPSVVPQIHRQEKQTETVVLGDVRELVAPSRLIERPGAHDHMAEGDRRISPPREDETREPPIADVMRYSSGPSRPGEGKPADDVAEHVIDASAAQWPSSAALAPASMAAWI